MRRRYAKSRRSTRRPSYRGRPRSRRRTSSRRRKSSRLRSPRIGYRM